MYDLTRMIKQKGYTNTEIAERWGLTRVRLSQIAANPKPMHFDAVNGLPMYEYKTKAASNG